MEVDEEVGTDEKSAVAASSSSTSNEIPAAGTTWCYLCGKRVGVSHRSSTNIFDASGGHNPVSERIGAILQSEVSEEVVPSQVICKSCHKSVSAIDELEAQLAALRDSVVSRHRKTVRLLQHGELPPDNPAQRVTPAKPHVRKTKISIREGVQAEAETPVEGQSLLAEPETILVEVIPEETLVKEKDTPVKRRRGRPPGKKKPLVEVIVSEPAPAVVKPVKVDAEEEEEEDEGVDAAEDEAILHDDTDPEFVPDEESTSKSKPPKSSTRSKRGRPRAGDRSTPARRKGKRGRPRQPILRDEDADSGGEEAQEAEEGDPDAVFSCTSCEARFSVAGSLLTHLKKKHGIVVVMCDFCGIDFETKGELAEHMNQEHPPDETEEVEEEHEFDPELDEEGDFQCEICNRLYSSLRALKEHKRSHYGRNYVCDTCHKRFASRALLVEHQNTHTGERPYQCNLCSKTFASKYCLKVHLKIHEVRPRPHTCAACGKTFMKPEHLAQHQRTHIASKDFPCTTCGKSFATARNLEVHAIVHSGFKPFVCRTCGKAFARRAEILDHERTHTGERPFQCETCGATFSQRSNLQSHKRATHLDDRRFSCSQCGKSFKRRRLLDYHTRSVHTGERPYSCTECSATFVYPEHFKKHRRIHTGEKPFRCEVCGKAFNSRDNRNAHRFIHSNKKPYECLVCGVGFMRKPLLYSHMQSQGHVHDTIVVNQPQVPQATSNVVSEAAAAAGISAEKVYITTTDETEPAHVEEVEHILIEGPVHFEGETEVDGGERTHAILVPVGGEAGASGTQSVQLVQIRLQQGSGEETQWIKLSTA